MVSKATQFYKLDLIYFRASSYDGAIFTDDAVFKDAHAAMAAKGSQDSPTNPLDSAMSYS
jgi:hypothetical protein